MFLSSSVIQTQNYPVIPIGQYWHFPDARSLSLGGAGSVSLAAPGAMLYNPATLTQIDHSLMLDFSLNLRSLEERRSYPLYDRFESFLLDATYAINNNWYATPQGAVAFRLPILPRWKLSLAVGSYPELDFRYSYLEEVREDVFGDQLIAYNRIEASGVLQRYSFAAAVVVPSLPRLSLGVQAGIIKGSEPDFEKNVDFIRRSDKLVFADDVRSLTQTPLVISVGAIYQFSERISGGVDVSFPYTLKYKAPVVAGQKLYEEMNYPLRINGGFEYRARQQLQARLNVDTGYEFWSNGGFYSQMAGVIETTPYAVNAVRFEDFTDVFYVKAGIEHIFFNKVPFGVGMQYRVPTVVGAQYHRNPTLGRGTTQTLICAGTGFLADTWRVDVAGAFTSLEYRWQDLFDDALYTSDPNFESRVDKDNVQELTFFLQISLKYFINFGK